MPKSHNMWRECIMHGTCYIIFPINNRMNERQQNQVVFFPTDDNDDKNRDDSMTSSQCQDYTSLPTALDTFALLSFLLTMINAIRYTSHTKCYKWLATLRRVVDPAKVKRETNYVYACLFYGTLQTVFIFSVIANNANNNDNNNVNNSYIRTTYWLGT